MVPNQYYYTVSMIFKVIFGSEIHIIKVTDKQKFHQFVASLSTVFKSLPARFRLSYLDQQGDEIAFEDQNDYEVLLATGNKSAKIIIRETIENFIEMTNQIHINQHEQDMIEQNISEIRPKQEKKVNESVQEVDQSVIEEKIKMMMPDIISKIKSEISQERKEKSKIQNNNQPIIVEEPIFHKTEQKEEPKNDKIIHKSIICDGCQFRGIEGVRYKCSVCPNFDFCERCEATVDHPHPFLKIKTLKQTPLKIFAVIDDDSEPSIQVNGRRFQPPPSFHGLLNHGLGLVQGYFRGEDPEAFRNRCQAAKEEWTRHNQEWKKAWNCHIKREKKQEKNPEAEKTEVKKEEPKIEPKVQVKAEPKEVGKADTIPEKIKVEPRRKLEQRKSESYDLVKANYLVEVFGYSFEKCLKWAQMYPYMTKEELLNLCLTDSKFLN